MNSPTQEEKRNIHLGKIKTQPFKKKLPKPCNYEKSNSSKTCRPRVDDREGKQNLGQKRVNAGMLLEDA